MFKNKKATMMIVSAIALTLALGLVAFNRVDSASAAEIAGQGSVESVDAFNGRRGGPDGHRAPGFGGEDTFLADELGITAEELQAAFDEARSNFEGPDRETDMNTLLADALGITVDELDAAREAAHQAAIEQALADGKITEEQVALMEAREALKNDMENDAILAKALGISVEELDAMKENGQRIPDILNELGIDEETFQANLQTAREEALQQAIEDGVVTQEQADYLLENDMGHGGPGGHGGRGGQGEFPGVEKPECGPNGHAPAQETP